MVIQFDPFSSKRKRDKIFINDHWIVFTMNDGNKIHLLLYINFVVGVFFLLWGASAWCRITMIRGRPLTFKGYVFTNARFIYIFFLSKIRLLCWFFFCCFLFSFKLYQHFLLEKIRYSFFPYFRIKIFYLWNMAIQN